MEISDPNERLILFFRGLANSIDLKQLSPKQLQNAGEFFMSYQFQTQVEHDNMNMEESTSTPTFSKADLLKFLSMGWYIYQILLRQESLPVKEDVLD